jgi:hypothetical protein
LLTRRRSLYWWAPLAGLALLLGACSKKHTTQELLQQAAARLAAGDSDGAERLLREALDGAPNDPRLYIGLARADLATSATSRCGRGIRFFGRNLTVRDSYFHANEDGVLTYIAPDGDILIRTQRVRA